MISTADIARIAHQVNKAYCESIGDNSQPDWEAAPLWQKLSAVKGVEFHAQTPDATPEDTHKSWLKQKEDDGWVYGKIKDEVKKTHPCVVNYHMLPQAQKSKDYIYSTIVKELLDL